MRLEIHIMIGALAAWALNQLDPLTSRQVLQIILGSIIFDIDHYLNFIYKERSVNLMKFKRLYMPLYKKNEPRFYIFHTIEFAFAALICSYAYPGFRYIAAGYFLHLVTDISRYLYTYGNDFSWARSWTVFSFRKDFLK